MAVVGAGALGQIFAGALAASGVPVTLLATPRTATQLRDSGRIRLYGRLDLEVPVATPQAPAHHVALTTEPEHLRAAAGLLFATKAHQLAAAIAQVRSVWPPAGDEGAWVAGVQNGVLKDDLLRAAFGPAAIAAASMLGAGRDPDGRVAVTGLGWTYFGEYAGGVSPRVTAAADLFRRVGLPAGVADDGWSVVWSKAVAMGIGFGVTALARCATPRVLANPHLLRAGTALCREAAAVAAASGVEVRDFPNFVPSRTFATRSDDEVVAAALALAAESRAPGPEWYGSMVQDLLAGRSMEVDEVFGDLVARAERLGVPTPRLTLLRDVLRGLDPGHLAELASRTGGGA